MRDYRVALRKDDDKGNYTVKQLARLSGVSVRTLHHYDEIGLLRPAFLGENRYRYYGREELLRLQDILFHRELGVPLQEIGKLLANEGRDRVAILSRHREMLAERVERARQLLTTIDRTIRHDEGQGPLPRLCARKAGRIRSAVDRPSRRRRHTGIEASKQHWATLRKEDMQAALEEGGAAEMALVECFRAGDAITAPSVAPALDRHRAWVSRMWGRECSPATYGSMPDLHASHPDFRGRYETHGDGFTDWLTGAMRAYAAPVA